MPKIKIDGVIGSWEADPIEIVAEIKRQTGNFTIDLDSPGGSVMGGISIANAMRDYDGDIEVIIGARSASIASYFMMFASKVIARDNSTVMIHNASLPIVGDFNSLRKGADISEGLSTIMARAYADKTGTSKDDIQALMNTETYYYGQEIVDAGFADELKDTEDEKDKASAMSLNIESVKACNNSVLANEKLSIEAVAKLLPNDDEENLKENKRLEYLENEKKVANLKAQQKRNRDISILTQGK